MSVDHVGSRFDGANAFAPMAAICSVVCGAVFMTSAEPASGMSTNELGRESTNEAFSGGADGFMMLSGSDDGAGGVLRATPAACFARARWQR